MRGFAPSLKTMYSFSKSQVFRLNERSYGAKPWSDRTSSVLFASSFTIALPSTRSISSKNFINLPEYSGAISGSPPCGC